MMEGNAAKDCDVNNPAVDNPVDGREKNDENGDGVSCSNIPGREVDVDTDDVVDDFVPSVEYPPLIPLPPLVNPENPHEDEDVVFEGRAKLYCFDNSKKDETLPGRRMGQWVERGLGLIKILQSKDGEKKHRVRVVMWRENVNTIACNHSVNCIVSLSRKSPKVLLWSALDFAFDCPRVELFSANFPSQQQCDEFMGHLERFMSCIPAAPSVDESIEGSSEDVEKLLKPLSDLFGKEKEGGSWVCSSCFLSNGPHVDTCPACHGEKEEESKNGQCEKKDGGE